MLQKASAIDGYAIAASDGRIGTVNDILFDDVSWLVRWLVVDIGKWLSGRKVLLPPFVLGQPDPSGRDFAVSLTMQQVKDSPGIDTERPVSRQIETNIYNYYGWHPYWGAGRFMGGYGYGGGVMPVSPVPVAGCLKRLWPALIEATTIRTCAASKRSPGTTSTPATARSVTSRTSSSRMPIGASNTSSSIRGTGGRGRRS
jgi:PRC-barrel domain